MEYDFVGENPNLFWGPFFQNSFVFEELVLQAQTELEIFSGCCGTA